MWTFYARVNYWSVDCLQTIKCNVNGCHPWLRIIPTVLTFRHLCRVVLDPGLQLGDGFQVSWRRCLHSICLCPAQLWDRVNHLMVELIKFEEEGKKFLFNLTCRTQHASRKHYHRTFYHSTHTPGDFLFNVYKQKLNLENQIRFEKENVTSHSPYNYLLLLPAFSSSQELLCFLMPCSVQPEILFDQKRLYNLEQITKKRKKTSASDFQSLFTASKIFLGLLFAFSQI